jgi:hypothetical protein
MKKRVLLIIALLLATVSASQAGFMDHFYVLDDFGENKVPRFYDSRVLIIPVIAEGANELEYDYDKFTDFFSEYSPGVTFSTYFEIASLGRYGAAPVLLDPIMIDGCPEELAELPGCRVDRHDPNALVPALKFLKRVMDEAYLQLGDFSQFDINSIEVSDLGVVSTSGSDGWLDGVIIATNGLFDEVALPVTRLGRTENISFEYGGSFIGGIAAVDLTPPMAVHGLLHLMGATDLYDLDGSSYGVGFDIMGRPNDLLLPGAQTRLLMGWTTPYMFAEPTIGLQIPPAIDTGYIYPLGSGYQTQKFMIEHFGLENDLENLLAAGFASEYFIMENRGPRDNLDLSLGRSSLVITHVDIAKTPRPNAWDATYFSGDDFSCAVCDEWHPYIMTEAADGEFGLQTCAPGPISAPVNSCRDYKDNFISGNIFHSDPENQNPFGEENRRPGSNYYSGIASEIEISGIDSFTFSPYIIADVSFPYTVSEPDSDYDDDDQVINESFGCSSTTRGNAPFGIALLLIWVALGYLRKVASRKTENPGGTG